MVVVDFTPFPRFCPVCGSGMNVKTQRNGDRRKGPRRVAYRWNCTNPDCPVIYVQYEKHDGLGNKVKNIIYESRPRLHYNTHLIYQTDISYHKREEADS